LGQKEALDEDFSGGVSVDVMIVTAPGGAGSEITTTTLNDGTALTLYAIGVDSTGRSVEDVSVTWSMGSSLGTLSTTTGSSTVFTPTDPAGTETITATHATLSPDSTGNISVTYTASSISGLQTWFRANYGVTYNVSNEVSAWSDASGNANDASQGTSSMQPIYTASAINGQAALRFDGSDDVMETVGSAVNGNSARTVFVVATNISDTQTYNALLDLSNTVSSSGTNYAITVEVAVRISGNRVFNEGIGVGESKVLAVTHPAGVTSSGIESYLDGVLSTQLSASVQTVNTLTNPIRIGEAAFANSNCNCDIAEIIVYDEELSTSNRQAVESYLSTKYGL
jgi:hypothetical protein